MQTDFASPHIAVPSSCGCDAERTTSASTLIPRQGDIAQSFDDGAFAGRLIANDDKLWQRWQCRLDLQRFQFLNGLDEPFTSLDKQGIKLLASLMEKQSERGGIIIFTSHPFACSLKREIKKIFLDNNDAK